MQTTPSCIRRVVILGHTGFVGSKLQGHLAARHPELEVVGLSSREADLTSARQCARLSRHFDLHTAVVMCSGIKCNYGNDLSVYRRNVRMAENICELVRAHPVGQFIFFSSIAVYGVDTSNAAMTESTPVDPDTYYALSKLDSERLLTFEFAKLPESRLVILRPAIIYGPGETILAATPSGFLVKYMEGGEVTLWGDGSELRQFLYVDDMVRAVDMLLSTDFRGVLNVGGDAPHSYRESIEMIERLLGRSLTVHSRPRTKEKVDKAYAAGAFNRLFPGFVFTPLAEGLRAIIESRTGKDHYRRATCRLCFSDRLEMAVPLCASAIGGAFVSADRLSEPQAVYPLDLYQCGACGHVQLRDVVNPALLFKDYSYFSGKTGLRKHFSEYAADVIARHGLKPGALVVDIGSNDGAFLGFFKEAGMRVLGIDPAENVAAHANAQGIETLPTMFDSKTAAEIKARYGAADIVAANNVFAHADNLRDMAEGIRDLLKPEGLFYFEVSYLLDVIDRMLLGAIFHEHLSYHTVKPMAAFLERAGLELVDVRRVSIQGGSLIGAAQRAGGPHPVSPSVAELIALEESRGVYKPGFFDEFRRRLADLQAKMGRLMRDLKRGRRSIAGFGAARGGTLMTYLFNLGRHIKYIVDDDPTKQGLYSPGLHIPVLPTAELYARRPDYVVILAWVHSAAIIRKHRRFLDEGGKFITFFPEVQVVDRAPDER